jgi:hypothetical protein
MTKKTVYDLRPLTTVQLQRLWSHTWARLHRMYGYQPFGYDYPTLMMTEPGFVDVLKAIALESLRRMHS